MPTEEQRIERRSAEVVVPENLVDLLTKHLKESEDQALMLEASVAKGIEQGMKALANDDEFVTKFWQVGYAKMYDCAGDSVKKDIGSRILKAFSAILFGAVVWVVARSGKSW